MHDGSAFLARDKNKKMTRRLHRAVVAAFIALVFVSFAGIVQAFAAPDYRGMVDRIGAFLNEAVVLYRAGQVEDAKSKVDQSYFEVFENLEGPIRVNISSRKNNDLEAEFGAIRTMIKEGKPPEEVESRIKRHMAELRALLPVLESGFQLKAEPSAEAHHKPAAQPKPVEARWLARVDTIGKLLQQASAAYEGGDKVAARGLIIKAQFDGYKNSQLETAIRQHVSQQRDAEFNAKFERILGLVRDGEPASMVRASSEVLVGEITDELPGLPLIESAKSPKGEASAEPRKDWRKVQADILRAMSAAIAAYREGQAAKAVALVQDTYFDLFEASGMESRIGARDATFKSQLEGQFSKLVGQMKSGAPAADLDGTAAAMSADLGRAAAMLTDRGGSLVALFIYALGIIVREGFEAMLIVTAILAYLAKTGNADKQPVIYNSVVVAVVASIATAILIKWVFARGGEPRSARGRHVPARLLGLVFHELLADFEGRSAEMESLYRGADRQLDFHRVTGRALVYELSRRVPRGSGNGPLLSGFIGRRRRHGNDGDRRGLPRRLHDPRARLFRHADRRAQAADPIVLRRHQRLALRPCFRVRRQGGDGADRRQGFAAELHPRFSRNPVSRHLSLLADIGAADPARRRCALRGRGAGSWAGRQERPATSASRVMCACLPLGGAPGSAKTGLRECAPLSDRP